MSRPTPSAAPTDRIPEDRVSSILARAAELDRDRRDTLSVDALRTAALDAGISPAAVDAALDEYAARMELDPAADAGAGDGEPRFARTRRFFRRATKALRKPLQLAGLFFLLGIAGAAGEGVVILAWAAWLLMAGRLILKHRPARKARRFALPLVLMTFGLAFGFLVAEVDEEAAAMLFVVAAPLLVLGTAIIKARLPRRFRSGAGELRAASR